MQTFDWCLFNLYKDKKITYNETMRQSTTGKDLAMGIEGITLGSGSLIREETFGKLTSR